MFTGLVQHVGTVSGRRDSISGASLSIAVGEWPPVDAPSRAGASGSAGVPSLFVPPLVEGESIAVSGCCLTLVRVTTLSTPEPVQLGGIASTIPAGRVLWFDVIPQTLRVTALGSLAVGHRVNLERSVTPSTLLGGHIVQGHVDGLGTVVAILTDGGEWRVRIRPPEALLRYLHDKGSIAVDGVSLTVAAVDDTAGTFDVCLIPETLARTTLGDRRVGDHVQLEADCLAKMLERLTSRRAT